MSTPRRLLLSPRAAADLEEIGDYIARDNPVRAASFVAELEAKGRAVAATPGLYPARTDLAPGLPNGRAWPLPGAVSRPARRECGSHRAVLPGARNLSRLI